MSVLVILGAACSTAANEFAYDSEPSATTTVLDKATAETGRAVLAEQVAVTDVWVTTSPIPAGSSMDAVLSSIVLREVNASTVPENTLADPEAFAGFVASTDLAVNVVITIDDLVTHYCFHDARTCDVYMPPETPVGYVMAYVVLEPIPAGTNIELGAPTLDYQALPSGFVPTEAIFNTFEVNGLVTVTELVPGEILTLVDLATPECASSPDDCDDQEG